MKWLRPLIPLLVLAALAALFFKMPCKSCGESLTLPLLGTAYFSLLLSISLIFPALPNPTVARVGLFFALLLPILLKTQICYACIIGHACHVAIWAIWILTPPGNPSPTPLGEKLFLTLFGPISLVALFLCLHLTFGKSKPTFIGLKPGTPIPTFHLQTVDGHLFDSSQNELVLLNFLSPNCPFCKEQLKILKEVHQKLPSVKWINVISSLSSDWTELAPSAEWIEDKDEQLRRLFKTMGSPTLFILGSDGKIAQAIPGIPNELNNYLLKELTP